VCGGCKKKSRPCTYSYGKSVRLVNGGYGYHSTSKLTYDSSLGASGPASNESETVCPVPDSLFAGPTKTGAGFRLRSSRVTSSGEGMFQTLVPIRSGAVDPTPWSSKIPRKYHQSGCLSKAAPSRGTLSRNPATDDTSEPYGPFRGPPLLLLISPSNETTLLMKRFVALTETTGQGFDTPFMLVEFHGLLPHRIGQNSAMDLALECFINSTRFYVNRTAENLSMLHESSARALRSLRKAMLSEGSEFLSDYLLLTVPMLHMAEVIVCESLE
jgi:hypothetical protein